MKQGSSGNVERNRYLNNRIDMRRENDRPKLLWVGPLETPGGITMVTQRFLADPMVHQRYCVKVQRQDFFGAYNSLPALRPLKIPVGLLRTIWNLLVFRPAIVHVHTSYGSGFLRDGLIALIMKGAGRKVVMTFHSGWGGTLMRIYQEGSGWLRRLTHFVLPKMDALVANGTSYQRFLQDTFGHRNIHVLPNPVTDDHIPHILPPYSGR